MDTGNRKSCCIMGNKDISANKIDFINLKLRKEIQSAINEGYLDFISSLTDAADLIFAKIVIEFRKKHPDIFLEAALPYPSWKNENKEYSTLLTKCNGIGIHSKEFNNNCFLIRDHYMINACKRVIVVHESIQRGDTGSIIQYAYATDKEVRIIKI